MCRVHVWVPELISKRGGIQTFSRCLVAALTEILGRSNVQVMAKNDSDLDLESEQTVALSRGWGSWHSSLRTFAFFSGIIWSAIRLRPQIVIATHLNFGIAGYVLKRFTGIRYWCVAHGIEAWNLNRRAARFGLLRADLILAVSNYTRQRLLAEQPLNGQRIVILPNTIDAEGMKARAKPAYLMRRHALSEGFGIVYLEALACGKPVLAGNSDGSSEPLQNGKVGGLVDADDVEKIASSLTNILNGTYPLDALYSPERLREESLRKFGFDVFKARLSELIFDLKT